MPLPNPDVQFESRSLTTAMWANLVMGVCGVTAAQFSRSDALLVDGLYSGVNFFSAIIATRVARSVMKPADRRMPFGYDANEAVYVLFRSLVLLGILGFAGFSSINKILFYLEGGEVPELRFGPIAVYMMFMVAACAALAGWHHYNWCKTGRRSEILKTERSAATLDGVVSAGAGCALLGAPLLRGTSLEGIIPVIDAIVVLLLALIMLTQPFGMFRRALREIRGVALDDSVSAQVRERIQELIEDIPCELLAVSVTKMGRTHFVLSYVRPDDSVVAEDLDLFRDEVHASYEDLFGRVKSEIIYSARNPFEESESQEERSRD